MGCGGSTAAGESTEGGGGAQSAPAKEEPKSAPKASGKALEIAESNASSLTGLNPGLEKINAADNEISEIPASIGECTALTSLDMSGNKLTGLPVEIGNCAALEEILCYKNEIKELPKEIGNLAALKTLNMFNNKMRKVPTDLGKLANLDEVNIAANKLMMIDKDVFLGWASVTILNLYDNNLVRLGSLAPLVGLKELRIYGNNLEEMPEFSSSPDLEILEVHKNRITTIADDYFDKIPGLKRIVASGNQIKALPASLCSCSGLEQIQVQENKIESLPTGVPWPTSLVTVFLQENPIPSLPIEMTKCTNMLRCNVNKLPLDEPSKTTVAVELHKICTGKKGGVFWNWDGVQSNG